MKVKRQLSVHSLGGSAEMSRSPLARCSSQELRPHQIHDVPSPTQVRSNSFVASRRCGVVSEQDVFRLASATDDRRASDPRISPRTAAAQQTVPGPWSAPVMRQRSGDPEQHRPRPVSTGYLPSNTADTHAPLRVHCQGSQPAKADGTDTQLRIQNIALLPNRQLIQQPGADRLLPIILTCIVVTLSGSRAASFKRPL